MRKQWQTLFGGEGLQNPKSHGDCSHEIKRRLLLGRNVMTNLDSILKSRDITLSTKVHLVKAMVFPVVMHGCESWTIKKAEPRRIDAFELWWWRRLLRVPWTARRSNQSILKEISPGCSLEGLMLKLKLQYFGHMKQRVDSLEKTLMLGKIGGRRRRGWQRMRWLNSINDSMVMGLGGLRELVMDREVSHAFVHGVTKSWTWLSDWTELNQSPQLMITLNFRRRLHLLLFLVETSSPHIFFILLNKKQVPVKHSKIQLWNLKKGLRILCPLQATSFILGVIKKFTIQEEKAEKKNFWKIRSILMWKTYIMYYQKQLLKASWIKKSWCQYLQMLMTLQHSQQTAHETNQRWGSCLSSPRGSSPRP